MDDTATYTSDALRDSERRQRDRKHIFAVNGASDFLDVVRQLFEEEHYNVTTTNFVPKTFDQIVALEPAIIIIDLAIHVQAGWDLLERLHNDAVTNGIPVIIVSTDPKLLGAAQADFARYGGQRFIGKPFDIDDLVSAVEDLIGKA
jgi:DNA-binding NtrC family response regulator